MEELYSEIINLALRDIAPSNESKKSQQQRLSKNKENLKLINIEISSLSDDLKCKEDKIRNFYETKLNKLYSAKKKITKAADMERIDNSIRIVNSKYKKERNKFLKWREERVNDLLNKSIEMDKIGMSIDWFVDDVDIVKQYCVFSGVDVKNIYLSAILRTEKIGYDSSQLKEVLRFLRK